MKKNQLHLLLVFMLGIIPFWSACSNSDDPLPLDQDVVGEYKGTLDVKLNDQAIIKDEPKNISITKANGDAVNLVLKDFSFGGMSLGTIAIKDCQVTPAATKGAYNFKGEETITLDKVGECVTAVQGSFSNGNVAIVLDIDVTKLSQKVKVDYNGKRLSGTESSEAKILSFDFDNPLIPSTSIDEETHKIIISVKNEATDDDLKALTPTITVSDNATVTPNSAVAQDFSMGKVVTYRVVAENGTVVDYDAQVMQTIAEFNFEEWGERVVQDEKCYFPEPNGFWIPSVDPSSSDFLYLYGATMFKSDDAHQGESAVKLVTIDNSENASSFGPISIPGLISGTLYNGKFELDDMTNPLKSTKFGTMYDKKPLFFTGWYKYQSGEVYLDAEGAKSPDDVEVVPDKKDECAIQAVLYEVENEEESLTGVDIKTSDKIVAVAALQDGTDKAEYTRFNIPFVYKEGKTFSSEKLYKLALIFSSSKDGDIFKGAGGSALIIDEVKVINEN